MLMIFFFFSSRRRHTRLQGDWSSDVCSSDLDGAGDSSHQLLIGQALLEVRGHEILRAGVADLPVDDDDLAMVAQRSEEHTSELQSPCNLVCRLLLEKKKNNHEDHVMWTDLLL